VPIAFGYFDYKQRIVGVGGSFHPAGDMDVDVEVIRAFYQDKTGKIPAHEGVITFNSKTDSEKLK
jgi:hypothetical protein